MKIYITGVAGFLGSHLARHFLLQGHIVAGCDNLKGGDVMNVPATVDFRPIDCTDFDRLHNHMEDSDVVFHCAALAHEGLSVFSPSTICRSIFDASVTVFSAAIANKVKRIVYCSSMARYGNTTAPFYEDMAPKPVDPYGIAKKSAEDVLHVLGKVHGIEYVIAVPHNIIGPGQKYDDPFRNVASIMLNRMKQGLQPIIYGDGNQRRCFSPVDDCIDCLAKMATQKNVVGHVINIGPDGDGITINELYAMCAKIVNYDGSPIYVPDRPQEVRHALCSSDKARDMLGYKPVKPLEECLREMADKIKPKPFVYHLPLEIVTDKTPKTWKEKMF